MTYKVLCAILLGLLIISWGTLLPQRKTCYNYVFPVIPTKPLGDPNSPLSYPDFVWARGSIPALSEEEAQDNALEARKEWQRDSAILNYPAYIFKCSCVPEK